MTINRRRQMRLADGWCASFSDGQLTLHNGVWAQARASIVLRLPADATRKLRYWLEGLGEQ